MRGLIQMQTSDYPQAEVSFQKALSINPNAPDLKHNYGILLCKMKRYDEGLNMFAAALANPAYGQVAKTYLEQGNCLLAMGNKPLAESNYQKSYELDAGNAVTGYHLAALLFERNEYVRAQFYARRVNNSEQATAESLWLGIKIERRVSNTDAAEQLAGQLRKRFGQSHEAQALERGSFDE
jgi:type IV pilus assembly protein PilF